jgi:hypothetical protein
MENDDELLFSEPVSTEQSTIRTLSSMETDEECNHCKACLHLERLGPRVPALSYPAMSADAILLLPRTSHSATRIVSAPEQHLWTAHEEISIGRSSCQELSNK